MIGTITGRVTKAGSGEYGPWALVAEKVTPKSGESFDVRYMTSGNESVSEGDHVVVTGTVRTKCEEYEGKHHAKTSMMFCTYTVVGGGGYEAPANVPVADDDDLPF